MAISPYIPGTNILTTAAETSVLRKSAARLRKDTPARVAVYDSTGRLIGSCDPAKITALHSAEDPNAPAKPAPKAKEPAPRTPAEGPAPQIPEDATDGPVGEAAQSISKAMAGAGFSPSQDLVKSEGTPDQRYDALVKSIDPAHQARLSDAVAHAALSFQFASNTTGPGAVRLAKSIALDLAEVEKRRPSPSVEAAAEAMKRARPLR